VVVADKFGNDLQGLLVTFTVHANAATGASAIFGSTTTTTAKTDADGLAMAPPLTANAKKGTFKVFASIAGLTQFFTLTID
jgi:hypothetical protein